EQALEAARTRPERLFELLLISNLDTVVDHLWGLMEASTDQTVTSVEEHTEPNFGPGRNPQLVPTNPQLVPTNPQLVPTNPQLDTTNPQLTTTPPRQLTSEPS